jgi:hypothetical protein
MTGRKMQHYSSGWEGGVTATRFCKAADLMHGRLAMGIYMIVIVMERLQEFIVGAHRNILACIYIQVGGQIVRALFNLFVDDGVPG